jgi:hypothetical protein
MNRFRTSLAVAAALVAGCASGGAPMEWEGLVRQPNRRLGAVFVKPDAEISGYRSVLLDPVEVVFARNWNPNRGGRSGARRLDARDVALIQSRLGELTREIFAEELGQAGYAIVDEPGPDTLRLTAAIVDLYVTAPDTLPPGRVRTYTANSGRMTLVLELRDSVTGEILARAVDAQSGRGSGAWNVTTRGTNTADARRAIRAWAAGLRQALDGLYGREA